MGAFLGGALVMIGLIVLANTIQNVADNLFERPNVADEPNEPDEPREPTED